MYDSFQETGERIVYSVTEGLMSLFPGHECDKGKLILFLQKDLVLAPKCEIVPILLFVSRLT